MNIQVLYFYPAKITIDKPTISLYSTKEEAMKILKREGYINYYDGKYINPYIKDGSYFILDEYTLDTEENLR